MTGARVLRKQEEEEEKEEEEQKYSQIFPSHENL